MSNNKMFKSEIDQIVELAKSEKAAKPTHDEFRFHRQMAANHAATAKHHWDRYEDDSRSSDPEISAASREHKNLAMHHDNQAERHSKSAQSLHDPKKHGPWNSTIPTGNKIEPMQKSDMFKNEVSEIEALVKGEKKFIPVGSVHKVDWDGPSHIKVTKVTPTHVHFKRSNKSGKITAGSEQNDTHENFHGWVGKMKKSEELSKSQYDKRVTSEVSKEVADVNKRALRAKRNDDRFDKDTHKAVSGRTKQGAETAEHRRDAKEVSQAGMHVGRGETEKAKQVHNEHIGYTRSLPKPKLTKVENGSLHKPEKDAIDQYMKMEKAVHPGPSKSEHQKIYDAKKQSTEEARLKTPEGEKERKEFNAKMIESMKDKSKK
jgi:hypothetical protein